ncbi:MAG TPA: uroporphyrinogen decarboxylase family protein [Ktedonobacterales bacterium]
MNKIERVNAAARGEAVDRVPVSMWGHDYQREWTPEGLAQAMLDNYRAYDWDYMKVNPRASYHVEDWGAKLVPSGNANEGPRFTDVPVKEQGDWRRLRPLDPNKGVLGEQLQALKLIGSELKGQAYFIQTIFNPLSVAKYLVGNTFEPVQTSIEDNPGALKAALEVITETFMAYAQATLEAGASGIFYATTGWASTDKLTVDQYRAFGMDYDHRLLEAFKRAPFNVLHNCGDHIMFDLLADYPVHAISWAATFAGNPNLAEGKERTKAAVMGGINEKTTLLKGSAQQVADEAHAALELTGGRRVLLAGGCSIPPASPKANLEAVVQAVRG